MPLAERWSHLRPRPRPFTRPLTPGSSGPKGCPAGCRPIYPRNPPVHVPSRSHFVPIPSRNRYRYLILDMAGVTCSTSSSTPTHCSPSECLSSTQRRSISLEIITAGGETFSKTIHPEMIARSRGASKEYTVIFACNTTSPKRSLEMPVLLPRACKKPSGIEHQL